MVTTPPPRAAVLLLITGAAAWAAPLTLASKNFTEQRILSAITVQYLRAKGFQVEPKTNLATVITRNAMINKQIDMTWEYTGTSLIIFNHINKRMTPQETYDTVKSSTPNSAWCGCSRQT